MRLNILILFFFLFVINCFSQSISYDSKILLDSNTEYRYYQQIKYPLIVKYADSDVQNAINEKIQLEINKIADDFYASIREYDLSLVPQEFTSSFESDYNVYYSEGKIFSFTYEIYQYAAGAAHPYYYSKSMNFDLEKVKLIDIAGMFINGEKDLKFISDYCNNDLKKQAKENDYEFDEIYLKEGLEPVPENFENISVKPEGLYVILNPYQVAPYVFGQQFVTIPYSVLKDKINPAGPLKIFLK